MLLLRLKKAPQPLCDHAVLTIKLLNCCTLIFRKFNNNAHIKFDLFVIIPSLSRCHALHISKIGNIQYPLLSHPQLSDIQIDSFLKSIIKIMLGATGVEERRGEEGVVCWKRFVGIFGIAL